MSEFTQKIKKVSIKKDRLNVEYEENYSEENYTNVVNKSCDQIVHSDLKEAFAALKPHLVVLCEQKEDGCVTDESIESPGFAETFPAYNITGYAHCSKDAEDGVTIKGSKMLSNGSALDLSIWVPLINSDYRFASNLSIAIQRCDWEVEEYLFEKKWGVKQELLDFAEEMGDDEAPKEKPKRKGKKVKISIVPDPVEECAESF